MEWTREGFLLAVDISRENYLQCLKASVNETGRRGCSLIGMEYYRPGIYVHQSSEDCLELNVSMNAHPGLGGCTANVAAYYTRPYSTLVLNLVLFCYVTMCPSCQKGIYPDWLCAREYSLRFYNHRSAVIKFYIKIQTHWTCIFSIHLG